MNWNLKLISDELGKIYNIDGFYGVNHPVKNSLNFRHPSEGGECYVFSCNIGLFLLIVFNQAFDNGNYIGHCFVGCI